MQNYADENNVSSLGFSFCTRSENEKTIFFSAFRNENKFI